MKMLNCIWILKYIINNRCNNYKCRKAYSTLHSTIFSKMKLPLHIQLHLLNYFILKMPSNTIASTLQITRNTTTLYSKISRKYIKNKEQFSKNIKTGGRNKIVEIDESKILNRKYNKGHKVEGCWIIGGIEKSILKNKIKNEKMFLVLIEKRDIDGIDTIINLYAEKGITIHTDCWKGYNNLKNMGYKHKTVDHKKYFNDPNVGVHTNTI